MLKGQERRQRYLIEKQDQCIEQVAFFINVIFSSGLSNLLKTYLDKSLMELDL